MVDIRNLKESTAGQSSAFGADNKTGQEQDPEVRVHFSCIILTSLECYMSLAVYKLHNLTVINSNIIYKYQLSFVWWHSICTSLVL